MVRNPLSLGVFWDKENQRKHPGWRSAIAIGCYVVIGVIAPAVLRQRIRSPWVLIISLLALVGVAIATPLILNRYLDQRSARDIGVRWDRSAKLDLIAGCLIGLAIVGSIASIYKFGMSQSIRFPGISAEFLILSLFSIIGYSLVAINEELRFRGHLLTNVTEWMDSRRFLSETWTIGISIVVVSVFFSFVHSPTGPARFLSLVLSGVMYSIAFVLTGRLALPVGIHLVYNVGVTAVEWDRSVNFVLVIVEVHPLLIEGIIKMLVGLIFISLWVRSIHGWGWGWDRSKSAFSKGEEKRDR